MSQMTGNRFLRILKFKWILYYSLKMAVNKSVFLLEIKFSKMVIYQKLRKLITICILLKVQLPFIVATKILKFVRVLGPRVSLPRFF